MYVTCDISCQPPCIIFIGPSNCNLASQEKKLVVDHSEGFCASWDMWQESCSSPFQLDSDMVFVPVSTGDQDHYSCICINFLSEQIEYLDNRSYEDDLLKLPYGGIARITASLMSDYLESRDEDKDRGKDLREFQFRQIQFAWHKQTINDTESGLFTMMHMLMYEGDSFGHVDLERKVNRRYLVIQLAATLVLADMNIIGQGVLTKVNGFIGEKDQKLKQLEARRKMARKADKKPGKK
ncbi:uncharacterized protein LOC141640822 [Silene latifolia]|uniref:uncharacterized protein LOC141640822 n=1 Tax=Silene latifolia TaxID=37657 RepID=UPI003D76F16C